MAAVIAEIKVNKKTGKITVTHIYTAQDAGLDINPGLVENQMMGAAVQGASRAVIEQVPVHEVACDERSTGRPTRSSASRTARA